MSTNPAHNSPTPTSPLNDLLPEGTLTLLLGDPGTGKSLLAMDLAARLSSGTPLPSLASPLETGNSQLETRSPATILLLAPEDPRSTREQRARAANANSETFLSLDDDLNLVPPPHLHLDKPPPISSLVHAIAEACMSFPFKLLILDPLPALLGTKDCSAQATIRALLHPLLQLAAHYKFAILGITHLNKRPHLPSLYRALGSLAYTSLARTIYLLTPAPESENLKPETGNLKLLPSPRRLLIPLKHNLAPATYARAFTIAQNQIGPIVEWDQALIPLHALPPDLNAPATPTEDALLADSRLDLAKTFLQTTLKNGPVPSASLLREATSIGISKKTLERARNRLDVPTYHDGKSGKWYCALPGQRTAC